MESFDSACQVGETTDQSIAEFSIDNQEIFDQPKETDLEESLFLLGEDKTKETSSDNGGVKKARRRSVGASSLIPELSHNKVLPQWRKVFRSTDQARALKDAKNRENSVVLMNEVAETMYGQRGKRLNDRLLGSGHRSRWIFANNLTLDGFLAENYGYTSRKSLFLYSGNLEDEIYEHSNSFISMISFPKRGYRDPVTGQYFNDIASFRRLRSHNS